MSEKYQTILIGPLCPSCERQRDLSDWALKWNIELKEVKENLFKVHIPLKNKNSKEARSELISLFEGNYRVLPPS